ncbi:histidine kinase dimerization/phosphoacceptor domain -containing protein [Faunimonas sp. B44]|uniref:histidine kinase dimerization/phosphoacceptor domain -containing protein n=1 Tax=Faunimonas sp. B44 TaxID=3461493 RepID=UPI004044A989
MPLGSLLPWIRELRGIEVGAAGVALGGEALRTLIEVLPVAIAVTVGPEHRFVHANRYYRKLLSRQDADPVGSTAADLRDPFQAGGAGRDAVLSGGKPSLLREVMLEMGENGRPLYWDLAHLPLLGEAGDTEGVVTLAIDITEKVHARREAELRALEANLRAAEAEVERRRLALAIEATGIGIWDWDIGTGRTIWSERLCEILGLSAGEAPSYELWLDLLHPADRDRVRDTVQATFDPASGGELAVEHRIVRPDGTVRWVQGSGQMLYDEAARKPVRLIGTILDVTERKDTDAALRSALAAKEILLREVNHRVKNSLQLVSSMLSLQSAAIADPDQRRVFQEAQSRIRIVAGVHERLYAGVTTESVRLDLYLAELCGDIERASAKPGVRIAIDAEPVETGMDRAVPIALVLNELVTNGLKYAYPDGGLIEVKLVRTPEGGAVLRVSDTGVGLPADFDERKRRSLGFRIVEGLARQLQGDVRYERLDPGTAFVVRIA